MGMGDVSKMVVPKIGLLAKPRAGGTLTSRYFVPDACHAAHAVTGTACVATDAGADGEVLQGGAGIVISTQGVTTQLRTLLPVLRDQPVLTAELGLRARARVQERYTLERNIDALEKLYAELTLQPIAV
jgi:2-methylaconitate cis-trans-isomerase PrpF